MDSRLALLEHLSSPIIPRYLHCYFSRLSSNRRRFWLWPGCNQVRILCTRVEGCGRGCGLERRPHACAHVSPAAVDRFHDRRVDEHHQRGVGAGLRGTAQRSESILAGAAGGAVSALRRRGN